MVLVSLAVYTFYVTDSITGLPVYDASCVIYQGFNQTGDAVSSRTDSSGMALVEVTWFVPRSYSVSKPGYITNRGGEPASVLNIQLIPTTIMYSLSIYAGAGGSVTPSGNFTVVANEKVTVTATPIAGFIFDAWVVNAVVQDNTNPKTFTIDRNAYTIAARFKEATTPPPPPPPNGNGVVWPVIRQKQLVDSMILDGGVGLGVSKSVSPIKPGDTSVLLGAKLEYTINYLSGTLPGIGTIIEWNGEIIDTIDFTAFDVGKSVSSSFDLTGKLGATNSLRFGFSQGPFGFNKVLFDIWITWGYSEEPASEPTAPIINGIDMNTLLLLGAVGVVALFLFTRSGAKVVVVRE